MCYLDRMFCSERECATACYRRYFGTEHVKHSKRLHMLVSMGNMRGGYYCPGYTEMRKAVDDGKTVSV